MSTKLYNGYRIDRDAAGDLFAVIGELRQRLEPLYDAAYTRTAVALASGIIDRVRFGLTVEDLDSDDAGRVHRIGHPLYDAGQIVDALFRRISESGRRNPSFDFGFEVVFLPDPEDPTWVYALIYTERDDYRAAWESVPGVEAWPYWNNTDRPDGVSTSDWEARRVTWDRVIGADAPGRRGLSWELVDARYPTVRMPLHAGDTGADRIVAHVPSDEQRARVIARRQIRITGAENLTPAELMDRAAAAVNAAIPSIVAQLAPITREDLCRLDKDAYAVAKAAGNGPAAD